MWGRIKGRKDGGMIMRPTVFLLLPSWVLWACFLNILCDLCQVYWEFSSLVRAYTTSIRILGSNPRSWILDPLHNISQALYLLFMIYNKMGSFSNMNFGILRFSKEKPGRIRRIHETEFWFYHFIYTQSNIIILESNVKMCIVMYMLQVVNKMFLMVKKLAWRIKDEIKSWLTRIPIPTPTVTPHQNHSPIPTISFPPHQLPALSYPPHK